MQFYLIPATATAPEKLEPTQDLARAECKARGLKPSAFGDYEVPTAKVELMGFVNDLLAHQRSAPVQPSKIDPAECPNAPPAAVEPPSSRPAMSQAQVDAMFAPKPSAAAVLTRDGICEAIADLGGIDLGFVALEVAARFDAIAARAKALQA